MTLPVADVKAVHAELDRLLRLVEHHHPWPEVATQAGVIGSALLLMAQEADDALERHAVALGVEAVGLVLRMAAFPR